MCSNTLTLITRRRETREKMEMLKTSTRSILDLWVSSSQA